MTSSNLHWIANYHADLFGEGWNRNRHCAEIRCLEPVETTTNALRRSCELVDCPGRLWHMLKESCPAWLDSLEEAVIGTDEPLDRRHRERA